MNKYKELFRNIGILLLSNFGSKLLTFFLVPLYTMVLSTSEYGSYDIIYSVIILAFPILTLGITEGTMRFLLDKDSNKRKICRSTFSLLNLSCVFVAAIILLNNIIHVVPFVEAYSIYIILYYISYAYNLSLQNIARGLNKIKAIGISGIMTTVSMLGLNILFLLNFRWGLNGYFLASIIANFVSAVYLLMSTGTEKYIASIGYRKVREVSDVVKYSIPLTINSLSWWINDVSDRFLVVAFCGVSVNGVYSVAYKIPSILSVVQSLFSQAWLISVTKEYKANNNDKFVKKIYRVYNSSLIALCSLLILFNKVIAHVLYKGEFYEAWQYVPFLLISVVFTALGGAISAIFSAEKDTQISAKAALCGAVANIVLNIILIPTIGVIGAAIATAASTFTVWIIRLIACRKYVVIKVYFHDILSYLILVSQAICYMMLSGTILNVLQTVAVVIVLAINTPVFKEAICGIIKKRNEL